MRKLVFVTICFVVAAIIACSRDKKADFAAANAAKEYYELLLGENYDGFVGGMNMPERIPDSYRQQLVDNARMYVGNLEREHHGLREIRVVNCVNDSAMVNANAFLMLCFGDSTIEEVVVPMVKRDKKWYMK
ncbi:MAG: hypothetical protein IJ582_00390 [Prevotella sp.]|nr:hypothetical protein [Prevotella sp.]